MANKEQSFMEVAGIPIYYKDKTAREQITSLAATTRSIAQFTLEQSSNPAFDVDNVEVAKQYVANMGGYGIVVKSGKVYAAKLNTVSWDSFSDGTLVSAFPNGAADFETMVHVPDCYALGSGQTCQFGGLVPFSGAHKFGSPNWVGAYEMYVDGSGVGHSRPGVAPSHSNTMSGFWSCAQLLNTGFGLANYGFYCLINAVYQARYGNLDSQTTIGSGFQTSSWDVARDVVMGQCISLGDGSGNVLYNDSTLGDQHPVKLFGFEDLWGKLWEFRPGIRFYMDGDVRCAVVYDGNIVSNTASGRTISGVASSSFWPSAMELGEYWDMLGKTSGGGSSTYYCDYYYAATGGELLIVGGYAHGGTNCGVSFAASSSGFSYSNTNFGARLAFYGEPEIVSGAELVSLIG